MVNILVIRVVPGRNEQVSYIFVGGTKGEKVGSHDGGTRRTG